MSPADADPLVGTRLGRYQILARLGEGGMGVVYRARDLDLERDVALKVLPPESVSDPEARRALMQEARTASKLSHPNICTIHEVGQDGDRVFVAMELVEGRPLRELVPPGGLPDETVVRFAAPLARALAHAHERGVVHRDLKSANVAMGPGGLIKLLDFGLSRRLLDERARSASPSEPTGGIAGTPQYLAPEVLMGGQASASSDIWSLGVVLHELCSGGLPFPGGVLGPVVTAILHAAPAPLPAHTGAGLGAVVRRCLAKEPAQRYASASEVAAALEALLPDAAGPPRKPPQPAPALRHSARRVLLVSGVAIAALVMAGAAVLLWRRPWSGAGPGGPEQTVLILPMEVRGQVHDAEFAGRAFSEALALHLAGTRGLRVLPVPQAGEGWNAGELGRARAAVLAGAGRLVTGSLTREGDSLRASLGLIDTREDRMLWGEERTAPASELSLLASAMAQPLAREMGARPAHVYEYFMYETGPPEMAGSPEMTEAMGTVRRYALPECLDATRRLVERFPREPAAHVLRVVAMIIELKALGPSPPRREAISASLEELHRLDPRSPWYDGARALLMPPGRASIELLGEVAAREDLSPAARGALLAMRADVEIAVGDTAAVADGESAVRLDPVSDLSLSTLARALTHAGRHADAALRVRQALALNPTVVNYWLQLANCELRLGHRERYAAALEQAAALRRGSDHSQPD